MHRITALIFVTALLAQSTTTERPSMASKVVRENGKVLISGVQGWSMGEQESSPHAAQAAALAAAGEAVDYRYLVGVSGLAFRMQVSTEGMCPSSPHPNCGYACIDRSNEYLPWTQTALSCKAEDTAKVKEIRAAVMRSIDRGVPVMYGSEENGVIVGYQKGGAEWTCLHPMRDGGHTLFVETSWPWGVSVFAEKKTTTPETKKLAMAAIKQAIDMAGLPQKDKYYLGFKAWEIYVQRVQDLDKMDEAARGALMVGNSWIYECIASYRGCAAWYLRAVAPEFSGEAKKRLLAAADLYEEISKKTLTGDKCVLDIAPLPWTLKEGQLWTPAMRAEEVRRLNAALELEKRAVKELQVAAKGW